MQAFEAIGLTAATPNVIHCVERSWTMLLRRVHLAGMMLRPRHGI